MVVTGKEQHIKVHCRERIGQKTADKLKTKITDLKINSSYIGMESGRTYQSRSTGKLSFKVQMGSTNKESQVSGGLHSEEETLSGEHALAERRKGSLSKEQEKADTIKQENSGAEEVEETKDLMEAQGKLSQTMGSRRIPQLNRVEEYNTLEDIRQQCILYLWTIFFGESRGNEMADKMGVQRSSNQGAYYQNSSWMQSGTLMQGQLQTLQTLKPATFTITAERETIYMESESTNFTTTGMVKTADGREISFNLDVSMSRNFVQYTKETVQNVASFIDPLVINLNGNIAEVSDQKFYFDLDADGEEEAISRLCEDSGYLALDRNQDGKINDGSELFGTKSGDGFGDLAVYDEDGNGWIDENDAIWEKLKIWVQDEHGNSKLYSLAEQGVGAICLQNVSTEFGQRGSNGDINAAIRNTGIFLYENGTAGTMQHLDLARSNIAKYA